MSARGHSLVEMVVIIGIISILLAFATPRFDAYLKRYWTEAQARSIYSELLSARANALYQRRGTRVKLYTNKFEVYSSLCDPGGNPIACYVLRYPIVWSGNGNNVDFDASGTSANWRSICLDAGDDTGAVDSVIVHEVTARLGKRDQGNECKSANITVK